MTDVSVIIPTYNRLWALPAAVESCRDPSLEVETIVVDDGSTDGTWEWLRGQPGVVPLRTENWGKDWAVQRGMAVARGEFVRFLDSDDWLAPRANREQVALGRQADVDLVVAGYIDHDHDTGVDAAHDWVDCDDFVAQQLGEGSFSHYSAFLFRRDFIADIPHRQEFALRDDRMFMLEVAVRGPRLAVYRQPAFFHRHHGQARLQRTDGLQRTLANWTNIAVFRKAMGLLERSGGSTLRRRRAAIGYLWPIVRELARSHPVEAAEAYEWLRGLDPDFRPPVRREVSLAYGLLGFPRTERLLRLLSTMRRPPPRAAR